MNIKELQEELKGIEFFKLIDLWLEAKTGKHRLADQLPVNTLTEFMAELERIVRRVETDQLINGLSEDPFED